MNSLLHNRPKAIAILISNPSGGKKNTETVQGFHRPTSIQGVLDGCWKSEIYIKVKHTGTSFMVRILCKVFDDNYDTARVKYHVIRNSIRWRKTGEDAGNRC
jgi:hypothetical protein